MGIHRTEDRKRSSAEGGEEAATIRNFDIKFQDKNGEWILNGNSGGLSGPIEAPALAGGPATASVALDGPFCFSRRN